MLLLLVVSELKFSKMCSTLPCGELEIPPGIEADVHVLQQHSVYSSIHRARTAAARLNADSERVWSTGCQGVEVGKSVCLVGRVRDTDASHRY